MEGLKVSGILSHLHLMSTKITGNIQYMGKFDLTKAAKYVARGNRTFVDPKDFELTFVAKTTFKKAGGQFRIFFQPGKSFKLVMGDVIGLLEQAMPQGIEKEAFELIHYDVIGEAQAFGRRRSFVTLFCGGFQANITHVRHF